MLAVHFLGNSKVELAEYPMPELQPHQVLVEVRASGICGSEMHSVRGPEPSPMNGGHEVSGIVADPNGHPQFAVGDRVGVFVLQGCGICRWCRQGKDTFCEKMGGTTPTHSQFVASSAHGLTRLPDDVPFEIAVLLTADGLGVPYGASTRAGVQCGEITTVFGCGPVGLGMVLVQSYLGAHVIAIEPSPERRQLALKMGAWQVVDPTSETDLVGLLKGLTDGIGPDRCFECSGRQDTLDVAMDATRPEGLIMMVGHGPQTLDPQRLIIKRNLTISGNWVAHPAWYPAMLQMYRSGLDVDRLITGRFHYTRAQEAFDGMVNATSGKVMLMWD